VSHYFERQIWQAIGAETCGFVRRSICGSKRAYESSSGGFNGPLSLHRAATKKRRGLGLGFLHGGR